MLGLARLVTGAGGGHGPSLNFNFVDESPFSPQITFTRASTATYFNSSGVLTSAGNNEPRFDYNPATLAARGFLIEEARTNLITSSAALPAGVNVTITADTFVAPDGTTTGDEILDNATSGEHYADFAFTPSVSTNYTFSTFIKNIGANSSNYACVRIAGGVSAYVFVALSTMTIATAAGADYVANTAKIESVNNGWYRVSFTALSASTTSSVARVQVTNAVSFSAYSGTGQGFAVWGRQLEAGAFPTSYIPTTTTALTRSADVASVNTLSPWFNSVSGTLYAEVTSTNYVLNTSFPLIASIDDGTGNNRVTLQQGTSSFGLFLNVRNASVSTTIADSNVDLSATPARIAGAYSGTNVTESVNGNSAITGTSNGVPSGLTNMKLGSAVAGYLSGLNGHLRRFTYYPRALSAAELQALTT